MPDRLMEWLTTIDSPAVSFWLESGGRLAVTSSMLIIAAALARFVVRRRHELPFRTIVLMVLFFLAVGVLFALELPAGYSVPAWSEALVGGIGLVVAIRLWWHVGRLLARPSMKDLQRTNRNLQRRLEQRQRTLRALEESEARLRNGFDRAPVAMALVHPDGQWLQSNRALTELLGLGRGALLGTRLQSFVAAEDRKRITDGLREMTEHKRDRLAISVQCLRRSRMPFPVRLSGVAVRRTDGRPGFVVVRLEDEGELQQLQHQLAGTSSLLARRDRELDQALEKLNSKLASEIEHRDSVERLIGLYSDRLQASSKQLDALSGRLGELTARADPSGLPGRTHLMEHLERELAESRRYTQPLCVLRMGIEGLDARGQPGRALLRQAASHTAGTLSELLRDSDFAARYGDGFCAILPNTNADQAFTTAQKLQRRLMENPLQPEGSEPLPLSWSIGIGVFTAQQHASELIAAAEQALARARSYGPGSIETAVEPSAIPVE